MFNNLFPAIKQVKKSWGWEYWLNNDDDFCCKCLVVNQGANCSSHFHLSKREMFIAYQGEILLEIWEPIEPDEEIETILYQNPTKFILRPPYTPSLIYKSRVMIEPRTPHRFTGLGNGTNAFLEVSTTHMDEDSYRAIESNGIVLIPKMTDV